MHAYGRNGITLTKLMLTTAISLLYNPCLQYCLRLSDISFLSNGENRKLASVKKWHKKPAASATCSLCEEHHALRGHADQVV